MGRVLERGDLVFFDRPRVEDDEADDVTVGVDDVERFFFVLEPDGARGSQDRPWPQAASGAREP